MKLVDAYQCDYCSFVRTSRKNVHRHELRCHFNKNNKSCITCVHLSQTETDYDVYIGDGEVDSRSRSIHWCDAKEIELNPLQTKCIKWESKNETRT